jgi:hypothetical protein
MEPFWIDCEYDRDNASDGVSRYGAYIRQARFEPWTDNDHAVELAEFAWRQATGPVMAPGYVRRHGRILSAHIARSRLGWFPDRAGRHPDVHAGPASYQGHRPVA